MMLALPLSSQDRLAEIWLEKVTTQLKDKGVEINFRINEEGIRIGGRLLMEGNNYFFDTDEMKIWYDGTTQWTLQISYDYDELYINEPTFEDIFRNLRLSNLRFGSTVAGSSAALKVTHLNMSIAQRWLTTEWISRHIMWKLQSQRRRRIEKLR